MRKIDDKLIDRLTKGDLLPLLNYIKSDNELRLEVRQNGDVFVYYRKGKALEIKKLKVDTKYGNVPNTDIAVSNPKEYFKLIKKQLIIGLKAKNKERNLTHNKISQKVTKTKVINISFLIWNMLLSKIKLKKIVEKNVVFLTC